MSNNYTVEEDRELNLELKKFQNRAKRLILSNYYDSISISDLQLSILKQITNAESHYDINYYLWNTGLMEKTLNDIADKIKIARKL